MVDGDVSVYLELITRVNKIDTNNIIKPIMILFFMTFFRTPLRPSIILTNIKYHTHKNKQKYTQQLIKRQIHTLPPTPPNTPFVLVLGLITGYYIYMNTPRGGPPSPLF
jgi:hypothetical protein